MSWQSTPLRGLRISGKPRRQFARTRPAARAAHRGADRASELERGLEPLAMRPVARCDGATLPTWLEMSFRRRLWNAPPSGTATVPAPYQLSSTIGRLVAGDVERGAQALAPWRWRERRNRNRSARRRAWRSRRRALAPARRAPDRCRPASPRRPSMRAQRKPTSAPTTPAPTTAMRPDGPGAASQVALSAVSMLAASTARDGGMSVGHRHHGVGRHDRTRSDADAARRRCGRPAPPARPRPRRPWRSRISPGTGSCRAMNGARMRSIFALRHPAGRDQRLGAAADRAIAGAHPHLAVRERRQAAPARISARPGPTYQSACAMSLAARHTMLLALDFNRPARRVYPARTDGIGKLHRRAGACDHGFGAKCRF